MKSPCTKETNGTTIILTLKEDTDEEKYSQYLETYELKELIKKYSDYIRYPIKMNVETQKMKRVLRKVKSLNMKQWLKIQTLNSMVPLWKRQKSKITDEEYNQFYKDHFYDYQDPQKVIHFSVGENFKLYSLTLYSITLTSRILFTRL